MFVRSASLPELSSWSSVAFGRTRNGRAPRSGRRTGANTMEAGNQWSTGSDRASDERADSG